MKKILSVIATTAIIVSSFGLWITSADKGWVNTNVTACEAHYTNGERAFQPFLELFIAWEITFIEAMAIDTFIYQSYNQNTITTTYT